MGVRESLAGVGRGWTLPRLLESWHRLSSWRLVRDTANVAPGNRALWPSQPSIPNRPPPGALCHAGAPAPYPIAQLRRRGLHLVRPLSWSDSMSFSASSARRDGLGK